LHEAGTHEGLVAVVYGHHDKDGQYSLEPNLKLIAASPDLLALAIQYASECAECDGTGIVSRQIGGDGYGDRCAGVADVEAPCPDCEDIRKVLRKVAGDAT
jgi:DnaJ-class molecular chaperone